MRRTIPVHEVDGLVEILGDRTASISAPARIPRVSARSRSPN